MASDNEFFRGLDHRGDFLSDERISEKTFVGFFELNAGATVIGVWQDFDSEIEDEFGEYLMEGGSLLDRIYEFGGDVSPYLNYFDGVVSADQLNLSDVRGSGFISLEDAGEYLAQSPFLQLWGKIVQVGELLYVVVNYA